MGPPAYGSRLWHVNEGRAHLDSDQLRVNVDVRQVGRGLHEVTYAGHSLSGMRFLQLRVADLPDPLPADGLLEAYVRGADLVANYATTAAAQFRPQIYWCCHRRSNSVGIELVLSMQTDLLDSRPTLETSTDLPNGSILVASASEPDQFREPSAIPDRSEANSNCPSPALLLFRFTESPVSYVEMVYPTDQGGFRLGSREDVSQGWRCHFHLFDEPLEKGVIRRARVAGWFLPREQDQLAATALFQDFLQASPPLTT